MKYNTRNTSTRRGKNFRKTGLAIILLITIFNLNAFAQDFAEAITTVKDSRSNNQKEIQVEKTDTIESDVMKAVTNNLITSGTYTFSAQNGVALEDMSSGTTQIVGAGVDDTASTVTNIGFDFWYDGVRYTQFSCNANGVCRLGGTVINTAFDNSAGFASTTNAPKIAPYFEDLCVGTNGNIRFKVVGTAPNRKLVVEWNNMQVTRGAGCSGTGAGTFQMWLFEAAHTTNSGIIQFVYGNGIVASNVADGGASIGLQSGAATNFASVTAAADTVSYAVHNATNAAGITAGKSYLFTPNIPTAPTGMSFTGVTATTMTVNWSDNSANEVGFAVYRSTDGVNFTFVGQTAANATAFADSGLSPLTNYTYRVYAVTEGAFSTVLSDSQTSGAPGNDTCNGAGGNWSIAATWTDGSIPTAADNVTIGAGCTVTINVASTALNITVENGGILQFEQTTARTLTVLQNVTIDAGGTFRSNTAGTVTTHVLSVAGNITNNGVLDFSTNADTAAAGITFAAGASNVTFDGTGTTTDVRAITVAKGAQATVVELSVSNFTVRGLSIDPNGFLTLTSGTFKISGTFTITSRTFTSATYTIAALGGFWLNNPNYTVSATSSSTSTNNNGLLRLTQGVYNVGLTGADGIGGGTGATFIFEGGTMNATRFDPQNAVTFTMSGGTINISPTTGNTRSNFGSFELFSTTSIFNMSGGTINLIQASVGATPIDWQVRSNTVNITGGTVNVGTGATVTNFNFRITGTITNMVVDNTTNNKTATFVGQTLIRGTSTINPGTTFALNGFLVAPTSTGQAANVINNGTITGNTAGSRLYFLNQGGPAITYSGAGIAGTTASPLASVDFDGGTSTTTLSGASPNLVTLRVILFSGSVAGANKLECGVGGASTCTVQIGNTTTGTAVGTFDQPLTFNLGTGGQVASYLRAATTYTTGGEVNPTRILTTMTVDNNVSSLNISGGLLTVTGAMALTNGVVNTSAANTLKHNGTATRTNGYVDGPLARDYTGANTYTYFVGENEFTPVLVNVTAAVATSTLTVESFDATLAGFAPANSLSRNWAVTETGDITADLSFTYGIDVNDVNGNEADYRVYKRDTVSTTNLCPVLPCVDTGTNTLGPITGVTDFSRWTGAELLIPTSAQAGISGRVVRSNGQAISGATVILSGGNLVSPVTVRTNPFGYYVFENLEIGATYSVTVGAKQYVFTTPSRIISLDENVTNADFVGDPQE